MIIYLVSLKSYNELGDTIVKVFSDKNSLETWLACADKMEKEIFGDTVVGAMPVSKRYKIKQAELDNLDFVELYTSAARLGVTVKPSEEK
jgi:hypothetical protein